MNAKTDTSALRKLAEAAHALSDNIGEDWYGEDELRSFLIAKSQGADAEYIAACDPQTILALLDEVEAMRRAQQTSDEAEFCIEDAGGMVLAATFGHRVEAWQEIQHYAAQYAEDGPLTIYEVTRTPVDAALQPPGVPE